MLSLNTLKGRVKVPFDKPDCFNSFFDGSWSFGTGKLVPLKGEWYFHIPATLKRISGRENRWMSDVNHQVSKALTRQYGGRTLFVIEDLTGVSFNEKNLSGRNNKGRNGTRSWAFYQFEQYLAYKAKASGSAVIKVPADYTSQRCPKCGRIHKENLFSKRCLYPSALVRKKPQPGSCDGIRRLRYPHDLIA